MQEAELKIIMEENKKRQDSLVKLLNDKYALEKKIKDEKEVLKKDVEILKSIKSYKALDKKLKKLEEEKNLIKEFFKSKFIETGTKYYEDNTLKVTFVDETNVVTLDGKGLRENYPDIADEFSKTTKRKAYVLISNKDKKNKKVHQCSLVKLTINNN